jgi:SpoVK/Ycf46/Vps4 family AAA+-type ATPase
VTNLVGNLDPAVLRPGVFIGLPDLEALTELLRVCMQDRPEETIDRLRIAEKAKFCTAAEIEHVVNEAARLALRGNRPIGEKDLLEALNLNPPA